MTLRTLLIISLLAACGDTSTTPLTQLNLDRPVDVAFGCWGGLRITNGGGDDSATIDQDVVLSAQPTKSCEIRSAPRETGAPIMPPPGQQDLSAQGGELVPGVAWYGLILQKGPGTVAVAQFSTKASTAFGGGTDVVVLDADPLTPGKNSISVGEDPVGIMTDTIGCNAVTINAGSCDLSVLDLTTALDLDGNVNVSRLPVTTPNGTPILSKPAAIVGEPKNDVIGNYCPAQAPGAAYPVIAEGLAYIAYPSCHLVAGVDLNTGKMVSGIQIDANGVATQLTDLEVSCPAECGTAQPTTPGNRPVALDLELDERTGARRLIIGSENSNVLQVIELDSASQPLSIQSVPLEGSIGITQLALSPVIGIGGATGSVDDLSGDVDYQFVYAVATDQTVRVAEVNVNRSECDAQVDPRFLRQGQTATTLACLRVGDAATPPRRATAHSPGIELGRDQVPVSVDFVRSDALESDQRAALTPAKTIGHFAVISSTTGETFVVTVDDDEAPDEFLSGSPLSAPMTLVTPHQLRDAIPERSLLAVTDEPTPKPVCDDAGPLLTNGAAFAGARSQALPQRNIPTGFIAPEKSTQLPGLRQLTCTGVDLDKEPLTKIISELSFAAPEQVRDLAFPDIRAMVTDEQWTLTWEGSLSVDTSVTANDGPAIRESMLYIDQGGMHLRDQTKPYCDAGVEPFDIVQMRGCDPSRGGTDCPIGYSCYVHPQSQVSGIGACILTDEAERLADACKDYLTSIRRYTVARAESGELLLMPRRHELRMTPLDGCVDDNQCEMLGDLAEQQKESLHPSDANLATDPHQWVCRSDGSKPPRGVNNKRCNMACDVTSDCVAGTVCSGGDPATPDKEGVCMEGVVPPQACVNAPQRYELRGGEAFVVAGSRSGYVHPMIADPNSKVCVKDPAAHPLLTSRIPLDPPACDPNADPVTGRLPAPMQDQYDANPCSLTVDHSEEVPVYVPGTCTLADPSTEIRQRQAPAIRYRSRGMTITLVDPFYPGDQTCIGDRQGPGGVPLDRVPDVFHGYSTSFRIQPGFSPLRIPIAPVFPVKVVRGPLQSVWIVDEGDFLSTSITLPSTRGKVFRVEANRISTINTLE
jgi:hypothetical protein